MMPETTPDAPRPDAPRPASPGHRSLEGMHSTVAVPRPDEGFWRHWRAFVGPALLVSVVSGLIPIFAAIRIPPALAFRKVV